MSTIVRIRIAACAVGLVLVAVLVILVPSPLWTLCSGIAAALLAVSLIAPSFIPHPRPDNTDSSDVTAIWLIGPMGLWLGILVAAALIALWLSLHHVFAVAWAVMVVWAGVCVVGWVSLRASTEVVAHASTRVRGAGHDSRAQWLARLNTLTAQAREGESKNVLNGLAERIRYAANDSLDAELIQNGQINSLLTQLDGVLDSSEELNRIVRSVEGLLVQREHAIRSTRSFA